MGSKNVMEHPSGSTLPELARAITSGAVRLAAATAEWLRLVAEFDERGGWHGVGINSCGHWLAWQCGMSPVTGREHVRVARALRTLPLIVAAFAAGLLVLRQGAGPDPVSPPPTARPNSWSSPGGDRGADRTLLPRVAAGRQRERRSGARTAT